jgi:hypothetical protein
MLQVIPLNPSLPDTEEKRIRLRRGTDGRPVVWSVTLERWCSPNFDAPHTLGNLVKTYMDHQADYFHSIIIED